MTDLAAKAGADAGLYSSSVCEAMSLSTPGELTGGNRNTSGSKGNTPVPNNKNNSSSNSDAGKYSNLKEPKNVGEGKSFTPV